MSNASTAGRGDNNNNGNRISNRKSFQTSPSALRRLGSSSMASRSIASDASNAVRMMQGGEEFRSTANSGRKRKHGIVFDGNKKNDQGRYIRYYRSAPYLDRNYGDNPVTRERRKKLKLSRYTGAFRRYARAIDAKDPAAVSNVLQEGWDIYDTDMKGTTVFQYALAKACKDKAALPVVAYLTDIKHQVDVVKMYRDAYAFLGRIGDACGTPSHRTRVVTILLDQHIPFVGGDAGNAGGRASDEQRKAFWKKCVVWKMSPTLLRKLYINLAFDPFQPSSSNKADWIDVLVHVLIHGENSDSMNNYINSILAVAVGHQKVSPLVLQDGIVKDLLFRLARPGPTIKRIAEKLSWRVPADSDLIGYALHAMQYTVAVYLADRYVRFVDPSFLRASTADREAAVDRITGVRSPRPLPDRMRRILRGMFGLPLDKKKPPPASRNTNAGKLKLNNLAWGDVLRFGRMHKLPYDEVKMVHPVVVGGPRMLVDPRRGLLPPIPIASQNDLDKYIAKRGIVREVYNTKRRVRIAANPRMPPPSNARNLNNYAYVRANAAARKIQGAWRQRRKTR